MDTTQTQHYELPGGGAFKTQHSVEANWRIANDNLIVLSEIGSTMHGVTSSDTGDDLDLMGICIEPPTEVIGLGRFEQYEYRSQPVNVRSGDGDTDCVVYSLRKWIKLAAGGNPTVLMMMFADPQNHLKYINVAGYDLRVHRDMFLSKQAGHRFLGYLDGQRQRYLDPERVDSKHASRPELIEKYGWDTKTGYHALRLAIQGIQLMDTKEIMLPMTAEDREFLLDVRHGKYSKEWVTEDIDGRVIALKEAIAHSLLPDDPDYGPINSWLTKTYRSWWAEKGL